MATCCCWWQCHADAYFTLCSNRQAQARITAGHVALRKLRRRIGVGPCELVQLKSSISNQGTSAMPSINGHRPDSRYKDQRCRPAWASSAAVKSPSAWAEAERGCPSDGGHRTCGATRGAAHRRVFAKQGVIEKWFNWRLSARQKANLLCHESTNSTRSSAWVSVLRRPPDGSRITKDSEVVRERNAGQLTPRRVGWVPA